MSNSQQATQEENELATFVDLLLQEGFVERENVAALKERYPNPGELFGAIDSLKVYDNAKLSEIFARAIQIPYINISEIDQKVFEIIDRDLMTQVGFVPFSVDEQNKILQVALIHPEKIFSLNADALHQIENKTGYKLEIYIASRDLVQKLLQGTPGESNKATPESPVKQNQESDVKPPDSAPVAPQSVESMEEPDLEKSLQKNQIGSADLRDYANSARIPELISAMILMAVKERASDIHVEPYEKSIRLRFRVDGELSDVILMPIESNANIVARVKILSRLKLDEQRVPQDGRFEVKVGGEVVDIRVSTLPTVFGEKVEMRLLSKSKKIEQLEDLGMDGLGYDRVIEAISRPYGVVLSTGPTGSGKSTTLYSLLYRLNRPEVNIVTLEDPVEYEIAGINQVQIKPQIGFGFADGLRSVLRQDPNIIMVGEIRDHETAELVTHAALTGHLVLSTLHTNNAASALPRLYNLGVEPFLLTSAVNAVIGQRLVRRVCQKCKMEINVPQSIMFQVKRELELLNITHPVKFYKGRGCAECKNGFKGRIGIFEVLTMTSPIEDAVLSKQTSDDVFNIAVKEGMITMKQDGLIKAIRGLTTVDEVLRVTSQTKEG